MNGNVFRGPGEPSATMDSAFQAGDHWRLSTMPMIPLAFVMLFEILRFQVTMRHGWPGPGDF